MSKRKHQRLKRRRRIVIGALMVILLIIFSGPVIWRIGCLFQAQNNYDIQEVNLQIKSIEPYGWFLDRFGFIKDAKLWLALNLNESDLKPELSAYQDDKHRFWLFLYDLRLGNLTEAENLIATIRESARVELAQGLLELTKGNSEESKRRLTEPTVDWKSLFRQEQLVRHLGLAHADLDLNDLSSAQLELNEAKRIGPSNPALLSMDFELAMKEMHWSKAFELGRIIRAQPWRAKNSLFETQIGLLALHEGSQEELEKSLLNLKEMAQGEASIHYLNGVQALMNGHVQEGKNLLETALNGGLDGSMKKDALIARDQINKRENVDERLKSLALE